jgi:hypothetical protein
MGEWIPIDVHDASREGEKYDVLLGGGGGNMLEQAIGPGVP